MIEKTFRVDQGRPSRAITGLSMGAGQVFTIGKYVWYPTPGAHEWKVWRHALYEFAQKVFQPAS